MVHHMLDRKHKMGGEHYAQRRQMGKTDYGVAGEGW